VGVLRCGGLYNEPFIKFYCILYLNCLNVQTSTMSTSLATKIARALEQKQVFPLQLMIVDILIH